MTPISTKTVHALLCLVLPVFLWSCGDPKLVLLDTRLDYSREGLNVGTALVVGEGGVFGDSRYYVIYMADREKDPIALYKGLAVFPDKPIRPTVQKRNESGLVYTTERGRVEVLIQLDRREVTVSGEGVSHRGNRGGSWGNSLGNSRNIWNSLGIHRGTVNLLGSDLD